MQIWSNTHEISHRTKIILKFIQNHERPQSAKEILRKRTKLEVSPSQTSDYTTKLQ